MGANAIGEPFGPYHEAVLPGSNVAVSWVEGSPKHRIRSEVIGFGIPTPTVTVMATGRLSQPVELLT